MRAWVRTKGRWLGACSAALAVAGCGSATSGGSPVLTVTGRTLTVYASQPPGPATPAESDTLQAEQLALRQAGDKAGNFTVRLVGVHDRELSANARAAIENESTIAYLGELVPGTSQVSVAILNQQGVLEVSPDDTAAYLTQAVPTVPGSPSTFYPAHSTYKKTFARVVPTTAQEAKALVSAMQGEHVTSVYVADDGTEYGTTIADEVRSAAKSAGVTVAGAGGSAGAEFYGGGLTTPSARTAALHALDQAAASSPNTRLFAPSGLYDPTFVAALSPAAQSRLLVSSPGFLPRDLPAAGRNFVGSFTRTYGHAPAPQAVFGYEAMSAVLAVLDEAKAAANQRATVVSDFLALKRTNSPTGSYSISGGDPSIAPFIVARVKNGALVPFKFISVTG